MAWVHDTRFDGPVAAPHPMQPPRPFVGLRVHESFFPLIVFGRVAFPVGMFLTTAVFLSSDLLACILMAIWPFYSYLYFVEPRLRMYSIRKSNAARSRAVTRPTTRYRFLRKTLRRSPRVSAAVKTNPEPPALYSELMPSMACIGLFAHIYVVEPWLPALPQSYTYAYWVLLAGQLVLIVPLYRRMKRSERYRFEKHRTVLLDKKTKTEVHLTTMKSVSIHWDHLLYMDYLVLRDENNEFRLYNHDGDPLFLLRLTEKAMPQTKLDTDAL